MNIRKICLLVLFLVLPSCRMLKYFQREREVTPDFQVASLYESVIPGEAGFSEDPALVSPTDKKIHLYGAGGEVISLQIIINPSRNQKVTLQFENFKGVEADKLSDYHWRVYRAESITVRDYDPVYTRLMESAPFMARDFPNPLIELKRRKDEFEIQLDPKQATIILVEFALPEGTVEADYQGKVILQAGKLSSSRNILLHTFPFDLPEPKINIFSLLDVSEIWTEHQLGTLRDAHRLILPPDLVRLHKIANLTAGYAEVLEEHGIEPWISNVFPRIAGNDFTNQSIEWDGYKILGDAVLSNAKRPRKYWLMPVSLNYPSRKRFGPYDSIVYQQILKKYFKGFEKSFLDAELFGKAVVSPDWPENYNQELKIYNDYLAMTRQIFRLETQTEIIDPFIPINLKLYGWPNFHTFDGLRKYAKNISPNGLWLERETIAKIKNKGKTIWWRPSDFGFPGMKVFYPAFFPQAPAWICRRYDTDGVILGTANNWAEKKNLLVYPGRWFDSSKPVPSIMLKRIRRSLQDIAYMQLLEQKGQKELSDWITKRLVRFAHSDALDSSLWNNRNDGLCTVERAWYLPKLIAGLAMSPNANKVDQQMFRNQFRGFTEGFSVEIEGVKARNVFDKDTGKKHIRWTYYLTARKFTDKDIRPSIKFVNLPDGIDAIRDNVKFSDLEWAFPERDELKLESDSAAFGVFGVNYQTLAVDENDKQKIIQGRYCALSARKLDRPIINDGDFDDWPEVTVTGDFMRICPDGLAAELTKNKSRTAVWPTQVRIGYDDSSIYLGFTCYQPEELLHARLSNKITSADGFAWGEDMVEIFIDPKNTSSTNPLDVFHIMIKANGNVIGCRGPVQTIANSAAGSWVNHIQAEVRTFQNRWQVEISIPLSDLDASDKLDRWWGMDFVRTSAYIGEISSWSGNRNQFGKPVSLGNIFIGR